MKKYSFLIIALLLSCFSFGTHLQGSEIYSTHLGGNEYKVEIVVHVQAIKTLPFFPVPERLMKIYQRSNGVNLVRTDTLSLSSIDSLASNICTNSFFDNYIITYSDTLVFDSVSFNQSGGYLLVHSIGGTTNYNNSGQTVMEIYTLVPPAYNNGSQLINSSPKPLQLFERPIICTNEEFVFDISATDSDGDSLNYRFYTPATMGSPASGIMNVYSAPYAHPQTQFNQILWASGFSESNQINGAPPNVSANNLKLDLISGDLTVNTDGQIGTYLVAVAIEEFRDIDNDGFKDFIGAVYRVLSFEVRNCTWKLNNPPSLSIELGAANPMNSCSTPPPAGSNVFDVCIDTVIEFILKVTDNDSLNNYHFQIEGLNAQIQDSTGILMNSFDTLNNKIYLSAPASSVGQLNEIKVYVLDTSNCRNTLLDSISFYVNPLFTNGLNNSLSGKIEVFPNPSSVVLNILVADLQNLSLFEIYDIQGNRIGGFEINSESTKIELDDFPPRLYFYQYQNQRGKFLIQR